MGYIDIKQFKDKVKQQAESVTICDADGVKNTICFAYQKTGYGWKRFFLCPYCSKRVQRLYRVGCIYKCQKCSGLKVYRGIRNSTKGGYEEIAYRMKKYAARYDIQFKFPFDYSCFALDKRARKRSFVRCLKVLQALENMRFYSLFFRTQCKSKVIKSVMTGNHPIIQNTTIEELKNNIYDWNTGMQIKIPEFELNGFVKNL